jgi:hypothetical protein
MQQGDRLKNQYIFLLSRKLKKEANGFIEPPAYKFIAYHYKSAYAQK